MSHRIEIADPSGDDPVRVLDETALGELSFAREHTAMSDFSAALGFEPSLEKRVLGEANIYYNETHLFRGYLETVESEELDAETSIEGRGIELDLTNGSAVVNYTDIAAWRALRDYWNTYVPGFDATVYEPPESRVTDGEKQAATTTSEFEAVLNEPATSPLKVENGEVRLAVTAPWFEGETFGVGTVEADGAASGGEALRVDEADDATQVAAFDYRMPADAAGVAVRARSPSGTASGVEVRFGGRVGFETTAGESFTDTYEWFVADVPLDDPVIDEETVAVEGVDLGSGDLLIDAVVPLDRRFDYTFDDTVDANGYLAGPESRPASFDVRFEAVEVGARVIEITLTTTMSDTSGEQALRASVDGETFSEASNTDTATFDFPGSQFTGAVGSVRLARTGSRSDASPTQGFEGQAVSDYSLGVSVEDATQIYDRTLEGTHLDNIQKLCELAGMRFSVEHTPDDPVPVECFAKGDEVRSAEWRVKDRSREFTAEDYANVVTVRGQEQSDGERLKATARSTGGVERFGEQVFEQIDSGLETQGGVDNRAVSVLLERLRNLELAGEVEIAPADILPGYSYPVEWSAGEPKETPLETVEYSTANDGLSGKLAFSPSTSLELELVRLRNRTSRIESNV